MAKEDLAQDVLEAARENLTDLLHKGLTQSECDFLLSFKNKKPDWSLLGLEGVDKLPAVRWKLQNIERMRPPVHFQAVKKLEGVLARISECRENQ